jgi:ribosomal-protein-alanine N-acetyltransferase
MVIEGQGGTADARPVAQACWVEDRHAGLMIEPAVATDLDDIVRIAQASFSIPWIRKMFEVELTGNPFAHLVVARPIHEGGRMSQVWLPVGYLCFWLVFEELRLMDLAVDPAERRRGVARALVGYALRLGYERGATRTLLEVRASNEAARSLYERFGFRRVARRANYYSNPTEDAILMELAPLVNS